MDRQALSLIGSGASNAGRALFNEKTQATNLRACAFPSGEMTIFPTRAQLSLRRIAAVLSGTPRASARGTRDRREDAFAAGAAIG
jgi:hypothetical protein